MKDSFLEKKIIIIKKNNNSAFRNYSGVQPPDLSTDHKTCLEGVFSYIFPWPYDFSFFL